MIIRYNQIYNRNHGFFHEIHRRQQPMGAGLVRKSQQSEERGETCDDGEGRHDTEAAR